MSSGLPAYQAGNEECGEAGGYDGKHCFQGPQLPLWAIMTGTYRAKVRCAISTRNADRLDTYFDQTCCTIIMHICTLVILLPNILSTPSIALQQRLDRPRCVVITTVSTLIALASIPRARPTCAAAS